MISQNTLPSLFISHGSPSMMLSENEARDSIRQLGEHFQTPKAIVIISAHWIDDPVSITDADDLSTIHDFGGFARELYEMEYPAKGDRKLSQRIAELLQQQGIMARLDPARGLDHGAWIPLMIMYPKAEIPVIQVSLAAGSLEQLVTLGKALAPLRSEGVLVIGSGGSVHNLRAMNKSGTTQQWVRDFEEWLRLSIEGNQFENLREADKFPPSFRQAHPDIDHYVPIIVAWAAGDASQPGKRLHHSLDFGNLGISHYAFGLNPE